MKNRNLNHRDDWATPPAYLEKIRKEFGDYFDPCPWHHDLEEWDGLTCEWGSVNFINPPYSLKLKTQSVEVAAEVSAMGGRCVLLLPVSTSTKLFHGLIKPFMEDLRFEEGRLRFIGTNDKGQFVNYDQIQEVTKETIEYFDGDEFVEIPKFVRNSGMHDSMIVIF